MIEKDKNEFSELLYASFNTWYRIHGLNDQYFKGGPGICGAIYDVYNDLTPGKNVVAVNPDTESIMGGCFYHPRNDHVSLGIMAVHPNYWGRGVGREVLRYIIDFTDNNGYKSLRVTQSGTSVDSFSLYNKSGGFTPRASYHDMVISVPQDGMNQTFPGTDRVADATLQDIAAMGELEKELNGIGREMDYRYCIENRRGYWHVSTLKNSQGELDGFMISCGHSAFNMLGPCVARTEDDALALILNELDLYRDRKPLFLAPMDKVRLVRQLYDWGAKNVEIHFYQTRGEFQPFRGVNMPTFLPETG